MLEKGYVARSPKVDRRAGPEPVAGLDLLTVAAGTCTNFREFGIPKTLKELESEVEKRRFEVIANTQRVTRNEERLAHYKQMVERCTIRAPHDGFVIYATDPDRPSAAAIEPGSTVRQAQKLFYLPDLAQMEVVDLPPRVGRQAGPARG